MYSIPAQITEEEQEFDPTQIMQMIQHQNNDLLDERGIIVLDQPITNDSIAPIIRKLLCYHFNTEFIDPVQVIISSPGGEVHVGDSLIDIMGFIKNEIRTIALGQIYSMATMIFMHGDHRVMSPNCTAMIHQFSSVSYGTYNDLVSNRKFEDIQIKRMISMLLRCSKYTKEEEVKEHLLRGNDNYLTAQEMLQHGLCDQIFKPNKLRYNAKKNKQHNKRSNKR